MDDRSRTAGRRRRPTWPAAIALVSVVIVAGGCAGRLGPAHASEPATAVTPAPAFSSPAVMASPSASSGEPSPAPSRGPLPTFDASLGSIDTDLDAASGGLGAAGSSTSEGNLK